MKIVKYQAVIKRMQERRERKALKMKELWLKGWTLERIGSRYGITRERARQLINFVRKPEDKGGVTIVAEKNEAIRGEKLRIRREQFAQKRFGCSHAEYLAIRGSKDYKHSAIRHYRYQKRNARVRKIGWELTLTEWWQIWQDSGKWSRRGRGKTRYAMSRLGDHGPYKVGNVAIVTNSENIKEAVAIARANGRKWGRELLTHCKRGHPMKGENLRIAKNGQRFCRECGRIRNKEVYWNKRNQILSKE